MKISAIAAVLFLALFAAAVFRYRSCVQMFPGLPPLAIYADAPPIMMWSITASTIGAIVAFVTVIKGLLRSSDADTDRKARRTLAICGGAGLVIGVLTGLHGYTAILRASAKIGPVSPMVTAPFYAEISLALAMGFLAATIACAGLALLRDRSDTA